MQSITVFVLSLIGSLLATFVVREGAKLLGFLDKPGAHKQHSNATPALGGVGILFALACTLYPLCQQSSLTGSLLLACLVVGAIGVADDLFHVRATHKLAVLALASLLLCWRGWSIDLGFPLPLNCLVAFLWVGFISSSLNGVDNADGAAGGLALISALGCGALAYLGGNEPVQLIAFALGGACLGFLVFNYPRPHATIFLGDCGSLVIGLVLSCISIEACPGRGLSSVLLAASLVAVPVFDFLLILVIRGLKGQYKTWKQPITMCARDHTFHRLQAFGFSKPQAILSMYAVALITTSLALASWVFGGEAALLKCTAVQFAALLGLAILLDRAPLPDDVYAANRSTR